MDEFKVKPSGSGGETFRFTEIGQQLVGVYLGSRDHTGDFGPTKKHLFNTEDGAKVVFGQKVLMDELTTSEVGHRLRITYTADKKRMKLYEIAIGKKVLDDDAIRLAIEAANDNGYEDDVPDFEDEPAPVLATKALPRATGPSADARARIAATVASRNKAS